MAYENYTAEDARNRAAGRDESAWRGKITEILSEIDTLAANGKHEMMMRTPDLNFFTNTARELHGRGFDIRYIFDSDGYNIDHVVIRW